MSTEGLIQKFYVGFYGRPSDYAGLAYWSDRLENEGVHRIMEAFASSYEARNFVFQDPATGRNYDSRELVNHIYQQLFGRDAELTGLDFYAGKLEAGDMTAVSILRNVMDGALNEDLLVLNTKLQVAEYFTSRIEAKGLAYEAEHIEIAMASLEGRILDLSQAIQQADVCLKQMAPEPESGLFSIDGPQRTPQTVWVFDEHTDDVFGMVVDKSGTLYSVSKDGSVCRIDSETGEAIWRYEWHDSSVNLVRVDTAGDVYSASDDNTVRKISSSEAVFKVVQGEALVISAQIENVGESGGSLEIGLTFVNQAIDWNGVKSLFLSPGASETIRFDLDAKALGLDAREYELEISTGDTSETVVLEIMGVAALQAESVLTMDL